MINPAVIFQRRALRFQRREWVDSGPLMICEREHGLGVGLPNRAPMARPPRLRSLPKGRIKPLDQSHRRIKCPCFRTRVQVLELLRRVFTNSGCREGPVVDIAYRRVKVRAEGQTAPA